MSTLQTRLFRLTRSLDDVASFDAVGEHNLVTSITVEDGTLAMYSTHLPADPALLYVFEVYASEEAYAAHRETKHFKDYIAATADDLYDKELVALAADCVVSKGSLRG